MNFKEFYFLLTIYLIRPALAKKYIPIQIDKKTGSHAAKTGFNIPLTPKELEKNDIT